MLQNSFRVVSLREIVVRILNNEKCEPMELKEILKDYNFEKKLEVVKKII